MTSTEEGGRTKPVGTARYVKYSYRPNWRLPGMTDGQVGAFVLHLAATPLAPGETARAVIVPLAPVSMPLWEQVQVGDELRMFEGGRLCGIATVSWRTTTERPPHQQDEERFVAWAEGAADDP